MDAIDKMMKKGGTAQFSLRRGSFIAPNGEPVERINEPMTDEEWTDYARMMGFKPEVFMVDSKGVAVGYGYG